MLAISPGLREQFWGPHGRARKPVRARARVCVCLRVRIRARVHANLRHAKVVKWTLAFAHGSRMELARVLELRSARNKTFCAQLFFAA